MPSHHKTVVLPECECSLNNTPSSLPTTLSLATPKPIKDNEIYYEPVEPNSYQNTHFDDQTLSMLNFNINLHSKPSTRSATETNEYLRTAKYEIEKARELPLLLYLDLDLNTAGNNNIQLENLKKMFINFHATEKDLSECINLHIYIFSKSIDKNTAVDSQKITEIQNKCKHTDSIIKESIYQINHTLSQILQRKYEDDTSGVNFSDNIQGPSLYMETISTTDDYTRTQNTESMYEKSTETMQTTTDIDYTLRLPQNTKTAHVTEIVPEKSDMKTNRSTITDEEIPDYKLKELK
ncbi:hypothetical protein HW555_005345 [Spodoptera exigua]|uniref:Uncharacterized protein n=1 Tax=Spodoptera exigua TaxID=7107 RepID=A0A835L6N7_SPOEX|nr:hypothetical protein HW555_005345 [Spodoptera exigua]